MKTHRRPAMCSNAAMLRLLLMLPGAAGACEIQISQPNVDYGRVRPSELMPRSGGAAELGARTLSLSVDCTAPRAFALQADGPVAHDPESFSFSEHGDVRLTLFDARVDDRAVSLERDQASPALAMLLPPSVSVRAVDGGRPVEGKRFTAQLRVNPRLTTSVQRVSDLEPLRLDALISLLDP